MCVCVCVWSSVGLFIPWCFCCVGVMQAFLKGGTVQSTRPQKDKAAGGPSTEKKAKAIPWVEK